MNLRNLAYLHAPSMRGSRHRQQKVRNVDCIRYGACLTLAAHAGIDMGCPECEMKGNQGGKISPDNLSMMDVEGSEQLLIEIFKGGFYETIIEAG